MSKRKSKERTSQSISYTRLDDVVKIAQEIIESGIGPKSLSDFYFDQETGYYDDCWTVLKYETLETDEEMSKRLLEEKRLKRWKDAQERSQYEALKRKFEK